VIPVKDPYAVVRNARIHIREDGPILCRRNVGMLRFDGARVRGIIRWNGCNRRVEGSGTRDGDAFVLMDRLDRDQAERYKKGGD